MKGGEKGERMNFCRSVYGGYEEGVVRCENLYNYCDVCCNKIIPSIENILNYNCYKACLK